VRHPMPYGNLTEQIVQRFASLADLKKHDCTIEEMEEYEPHIAEGNVVYAGADYEKILREAEKEADVIIWDGGNNDTPFFKPTIHITVVDPLRPGHEVRYFPGRTNFERADVLIINKMDQARPEDLAIVRRNIAEHNASAVVLEANSPIFVESEASLRGKRVLVVEDGPTVTHGEMGYGAGWIAAHRAGAVIVDPRPYLKGEMAEVYTRYPHLREVLPALGYGEAQIAELQATIHRADCDIVVIGTPIDLGRIIDIDKPSVRVTYRLEEITKPGLKEILADRIG
jgi:predicted GTPase